MKCVVCRSNWPFRPCWTFAWQGHGVLAGSCELQCMFDALLLEATSNDKVDGGSNGHRWDSTLIERMAAACLPRNDCVSGQYRLDSGQCAPCTAGFYSNTSNQRECTECPAGSRFSTVRSVGMLRRHCRALPARTAMQRGSMLDSISSCRCEQGYYGKHSPVLQY